MSSKLTVPPLPFKHFHLLITQDLGLVSPKTGMIKRRRVLAICDCGQSIAVDYSNIKSGNTKSCGCSRSKSTQERLTTHGETGTTEYAAWKTMKARCNNPKNKSYPRYGGRGIQYDARWEQYENFKKDMGERPEGLTLERMDNNLHYTKSNCKWATYTEQARNRSNNKLITYKGETLCLQEWANKLGVNREVLAYQLTKRPLEVVFKGIIMNQEKSMFQEVSDMNIAFGNNFGGNTTARIQKQCANIPDEFKELQLAIAAKDITEVRDATCDILVFSLGAFHLLGRDFDELYSHEGVPRIDYSRHDTWGALELHSKRFELLMNSLKESFLPEGGPQQAEEDLADIVMWAMQIADITGFPALEDMHAVYVSNMSKFCANQQELDATFDKYLALGVEVYAEGDFPTMCLKSSKDQKDINGDNYPRGKFLKGVNYKPPVFA